MQILKLCRFGKACKRNLIKFRGTELQKHIENPIKPKIELLEKNKIALTKEINEKTCRIKTS